MEILEHAFCIKAPPKVLDFLLDGGLGQIFYYLNFRHQNKELHIIYACVRQKVSSTCFYHSLLQLQCGVIFLNCLVFSGLCLIQLDLH